MRARVGKLLSRVSAPLALLARADGGAAAVYVAIVIPAFVGAGGLAVDIASWYVSKRTMQSGADAAAFAAALELARQGLDQDPDLTAMQAVADDAAGRNGVGTTVTLNVPPLSGPAVGDPQSVEVIVTEPAPVHFAGMFLNAPPVITTRAVAKAVVSDACVWALHPGAPSALHVAGTADVDLSCGVVVNSDHAEALDQDGTSCLSATSVSVTGNYSGSCVSPEPEIYVQDYGDPLGSLLEPTVGSCDHTTNIDVSGGGNGRGNGNGGGGPVTLMPGVYCAGINIDADVIFEPGLYILKGDKLRVGGNATVTNNENASGGITFYLTGSSGNYAYVEIESGADVTLTPMTTGPLANVLFFQDRNAPADGNNRIAGGVTMDITGILYFPSQHVEFTGGSATDEADILLVASTITFTGNSYLNADYAQSLLPEQYFARFVE
jgi:Putative Flp pilus-assembly TadE/G-like